jgi:hypothetical protein
MGFISEKVSELSDLADEISRMLNALIDKVESNEKVEIRG